jgi:hypothetical protein
MSDTSRISWLEVLNQSERFEVILWSTFARKRFYIFEYWWNIGKASRPSYKDTKKLTYRDVRIMYKDIKNSKK